MGWRTKKEYWRQRTLSPAITFAIILFQPALLGFKFVELFVRVNLHGMRGRRAQKNAFRRFFHDQQFVGCKSVPGADAFRKRQRTARTELQSFIPFLRIY